MGLHRPVCRTLPRQAWGGDAGKDDKEKRSGSSSISQLYVIRCSRPRNKTDGSREDSAKERREKKKKRDRFSEVQESITIERSELKADGA